MLILAIIQRFSKITLINLKAITVSNILKNFVFMQKSFFRTNSNISEILNSVLGYIKFIFDVLSNATSNFWFSLWEKKLKTGKNLLVLSKGLLATTARTWDSLRFWVSPKHSMRINFDSFWVKTFLIWGWNSFMREWQHLSHRESLFSQW